MMIRRSLIALGAAGLVALTATSPAHAADLGLRSVQASVQNMTGGTLTIALAEVLSGQWVSGEQPTLSEVLPVSGSMNAGRHDVRSGGGSLGHVRFLLVRIPHHCCDDESVVGRTRGSRSL